MDNNKVVIFWFRRDLRLYDNKGLYLALKSGYKVLPVFIFDEKIIKTLDNDDARISMIHSALGSINDAMEKNRCNVGMYLGNPKAVFLEILKKYLDSAQIASDWDVLKKAREEVLVNSLSMLCPFEPEEKQVLLEAETIVKRLDVLVTLMKLSSENDLESRYVQ